MPVLHGIAAVDRIKVIIQDLSPDGDRQLLDLYKQVPGHRKRDQAYSVLDELCHLLIRISENWDRYTTFFHDPGISWTNNRTAQAIGRMKMRARTMRADKTDKGMLNVLWVSSVFLT